VALQGTVQSGWPGAQAMAGHAHWENSQSGRAVQAVSSRASHAAGIFWWQVALQGTPQSGCPSAQAMAGHIHWDSSQSGRA
jgi:hypothetical protein